MMYSIQMFSLFLNQKSKLIFQFILKYYICNKPNKKCLGFCLTLHLPTIGFFIPLS